MDFEVTMHNDKKEQSINVSSHKQHKTKDPKRESLNDTVITNQQNNDKSNKDISITNIIHNANHPIICIILIVIKCFALLSFILFGFFIKSETIYLIVILLGVCDFWITKNIAGRRLVGLRWWNEVKENGDEVWIFESKNNHNESTTDKNVFWITLYINAGLWFLLFFYEMITFSITWFVIAVIMLTFACINLYGYLKCSEDQQRKITSISSKFAMKIIQKKI